MEIQKRKEKKVYIKITRNFKDILLKTLADYTRVL